MSGFVVLLLECDGLAVLGNSQNTSLYSFQFRFGYVPKLSEAELDHVQIAAPGGCEEAARSFFGALAGLTEIQKPEPLRALGGVWFAPGEQQLHIGVEKEFQPARKAHVEDAWGNRIEFLSSPTTPE